MFDTRQITKVLGDVDCNVWMVAPMFFQNKVLGVIVVQSYDPEIGYDDDDLKLLTFVADHIAAALSRKQSDEALRAAHAHLAAGSAALQAKNRELETTLNHLGVAQGEWVRPAQPPSPGPLVAGPPTGGTTRLWSCPAAGGPRPR